MTVTATDNPAVVLISENGIKGPDGIDGTDGAGYNQARKLKLDSPLTWLYARNHLVKNLRQLLTVSRTTSGAYDDIYGQAQVAGNDEAREEVEGWLINGDELDVFEVYGNVPSLQNDFSIVLEVGAYSETSPSQNIITVPSATGNAISIGTDATGNWLVTVKDSGLTDRQVTTVISATSAVQKTIIITYSTATVSIYIGGALAGSETLSAGALTSVDTQGLVSITGDFNLNINGLRFYDFALNNDEITYLS
jgi:hypothetical protein